MSKKANQKYKDTVFRNLFGTDEKAEEKFIALYNALHNEPLTNPKSIRSLDIEQVLYMNLANDIARLVDNKIIILAEHQSTINENMPLRCLQYIARIYEQLQDTKDKYRRKMLKIPTPEFFVFYNGIEDYPTSKELKLSDAFMIKGQELQLELCVKVININTNKNNEILKVCPVLKEYSLFVDSVRKNLEKDPENGYDTAIKECMQNNILKEYLTRKSKEVHNMLMAEYDYETDMEVRLEEACERAFDKGIARGIEQGIEQGNLKTASSLKNMGISSSQIAQATGLSVEKIEQL